MKEQNKWFDLYDTCLHYSQELIEADIIGHDHFQSKSYVGSSI